MAYKYKYNLHDQYAVSKHISEKFNGNVPLVTEKPQLSDYGLSDDIEGIMKEEQKKIEKSLRRKYWLIGLAIIVALSYLVNEWLMSFDEWYYHIILFLFIGGPIILCITDDLSVQARSKVKNTEIGKKYNKYKDDLNAYVYWYSVNSLDFWLNLDGHQFEEAVANLYRHKGYKAIVSQMGGDGGIDIKLEKDGKEIAVQCKAHKRPVGPAVARDLYGTMLHLGYKEGVIISTNGFTKGVYEFVEDKPIELISATDLIYGKIK